MAVTKTMERLVNESAALNVRLAQKLKGRGLDILIWVSPSACRSPEESKIWHPFYARKTSAERALIYLYLVSLYFILGTVRFFAYKGFFFNFIRSGSRALLIIPDEITDHSKEIRTDYITEDPDFPVDKLVFSRIKNIGSKFTTLNLLMKAKISLILFNELILDFIRQLISGRLNRDYMDSFIILFRWVISHSWFFHWDFYHFLKKKTKSDPGYKVFLSLHEVHFYSKVIWKVAHEYGIIGVTAQHAIIIPEKLWYYPERSEIEADCPTPNVFFVYSQRIKDMLKPFYPDTEISLCCSPRFAKWKAARERGTKDISERGFVTFVSGIVACDTTILIRAITNLLKQNPPDGVRIKLRLHPHAIVRKSDKMWIDRAVRDDVVELSMASLNDDLLNSRLVLGSISTVLQEAILLGVPPLSLYSKDFVHPSILPDGDAWNVQAETLTWERLKNQWSISLNPDIKKEIREDMGINSPDLSTKLIFETAGIPR